MAMVWVKPRSAVSFAPEEDRQLSRLRHLRMRPLCPFETFPFLILIAGFATLDLWPIQERHTHAPRDDRGEFRSGWRGITSLITLM